MIRNKTLAALVVVLLVVATAGCSVAPSAAGSASVNPAATTPAAGQATPGPGKTNLFGWEIPDKTIEFTAYDAEQLNPSETENGTKNMNQYLLDNFNVKITRIFEDMDPKERLNLMLTAGDYPEVIYWMKFEDMTKWAGLGKLVEMTPKMDTVMPDIKGMIGDVLPLYLDDGKLWGVPIGCHWLDIPDYTAHLRYDWLQDMGNPAVKTPGDFYNVVMQMLLAHPTNANGEKTYSISLYNTGTSDYIFSLCGYWGLKNGWKIDGQDKFTYWAFTDEGREMTQWWNKFYRSGTMDPDAFVNKFEEWKTKFSNERIVSAIGGWWIGLNAGSEVWMRTDPDWNENKRFVQVTFKDEQAEAAYLTPKDSFGYGFSVITDKAADPEGIMKFFNFEATTLGRALTGWGIPNECPGVKTANVSDWDLDGSGNFAFKPDTKKELIEEKYDYAERLSNGNWIYPFFMDISRWPDGIHCCWNNQMWFDENKWKQILIENTKGTIYDFTAAHVSIKADDPMLLVKTAVTDTWRQNWPLCVQANSDAEFETAWKNMQEALTAAGIEQYTAFCQQTYADNLAKMGSK